MYVSLHLALSSLYFLFLFTFFLLVCQLITLAVLILVFFL